MAEMLVEWRVHLTEVSSAGWMVVSSEVMKAVPWDATTAASKAGLRASLWGQSTVESTVGPMVALTVGQMDCYWAVQMVEQTDSTMVVHSDVEKADMMAVMMAVPMAVVMAEPTARRMAAWMAVTTAL
jgi:hypothetical protein